MSTHPLAQPFKDAMSQFASGVTVVTTLYGDTPIGVTATAFSSVGVNPPMVLICLDKSLFTHQVIEDSGVFAVNILGAGQQDWAKRFAGMQPEHNEARFEGIDYKVAETSCPILPGSLSWVDCRVKYMYDGGDHSIVVGTVLAVGSDSSDGPLLYHNRHWHQLRREVA